MNTLDKWFSSGERISIRTEANDVDIFCRTDGQGSWLTFLHGFPTCSWDWSKITEGLKRKHRLLLFDFLGFGDSDKPRGHKYSIFEQADITETLWQRFDIEQTTIVAHDYGDTVALELLSRQEDDQLTTKISSIVMLNGGIYVNQQRPLLIQQLLHLPLFGPITAGLISEKTFKKQFASIFSKSHPISDDELEQFWRIVSSRNGIRRSHKIIRYLSERKKFKTRWEHTLEKSKTPIRFLWGLEDPISGKNISDQLRKNIPTAKLREMPNVGHYPHWEVPSIVIEEILNK